MQMRFTPCVGWSEREWLWNERIMKAIFLDRDRFAIAVAVIVGIPFLLLLLASLPLLAIVLPFRSPPSPRGLYSVGVHDVLDAGGHVRFRLFYPCDAARASGRRAWWWPQPAVPYVAAYLSSTGLPRWFSNLLALPISFGRAPAALHPSAPALPPPASVADAGGWPLSYFSHGLLGWRAPTRASAPTSPRMAAWSSRSSTPTDRLCTRA